MAKASEKDMPRVEVQSRAELRRWLEKNHGKSQGVWLVIYKKHVADKHLPYEEMVAEALCFGWIDSLPRKLDADRSMRYLSPRKPGSPWSRINKGHIKKLKKAKLIRPAGLRAIEQARADGSWSVLDDVEDLIVPPDLKRALAAVPPALKNFETFPPSAKKGLLWWVKSAKTDATRSKRIAETADKAAQNIRANQWRP